MGIVSEGNSGAGQVSMDTKQLLSIKTLKGLVVHSTHGVTVREHCMAVTIHIRAQHGGFAYATLSQ